MKFTLYYPYYYERTNSIEVEPKTIRKKLQGKEKHWYNAFLISLWLTIIVAFAFIVSIILIEYARWLPFVLIGVETVLLIVDWCINNLIDCISYDNLQEKYCKDELEKIKQMHTKCEEQKQQVENKKKEWCRKVLEEQDVESLYNIIKMLE